MSKDRDWDADRRRGRARADATEATISKRHARNDANYQPMPHRVPSGEAIANDVLAALRAHRGGPT